MKLVFFNLENEDESRVIESGWFQVTYEILRDDNDNEIAVQQDRCGLWEFEGELYSDFIIYNDSPSGE